MQPADSVSSRTERAQAWALSLRTNFRTIILGTCSPAGLPDASVAGACLSADGAFYLPVSGLAVHTHNLLTTRRASVLLIEDEAAAAQPLARRRITFACAAEPVLRESAECAVAFRTLRERLGPAFDVISSLGDFQLMRLTPERGRLVAGFGQAFEVDPRDWTLRSPPLGPDRLKKPTAPSP